MRVLVLSLIAGLSAMFLFPTVVELGKKAKQYFLDQFKKEDEDEKDREAE